MLLPNSPCRLDLEDRAAFDALPPIPRAFAAFSRPAEVPVDWHKTENQGQIGSCQGNGLTSVLERLQFVRFRDPARVVQLSRMFAYLATQKLDGLLGNDQGSTISNGVKLALSVGVPPEELTGYPSAYPGRAERDRILSQANYAAGEPFKAVSSWRCPEDPDEAMNFIGGGGGISFGIPYWEGLIPRDRVVRSFNPPSRFGSHAMANLGYTVRGTMRGVNSHKDGPFEIAPEAWRAMIRHPWTVAIGLVGTEDSGPVDWLNDSYISSGLYPR